MFVSAATHPHPTLQDPTPQSQVRTTIRACRPPRKSSPVGGTGGRGCHGNGHCHGNSKHGDAGEPAAADQCSNEWPVPTSNAAGTVYSFEFAKSYFHPTEIWNWFSQSWICPLSNCMILMYNSICPVSNLPSESDLRVKIKWGLNFPWIQY